MEEDLDLLLLKCQGALKELDNENFVNPWEVSDASEFLRYICPECDHNSRSLEKFSSHALAEHPKSARLFDKVAECSAKDHKNMINILENVDNIEDDFDKLAETIWEGSIMNNSHKNNKNNTKNNNSENSDENFKKFASNMVKQELKRSKPVSIMNKDEETFYEKLQKYMDDGDMKTVPPQISKNKSATKSVNLKPEQVLFDADQHAIPAAEDIEDLEDIVNDHIPYIQNVVELNNQGKGKYLFDQIFEIIKIPVLFIMIIFLFFRC